MAGQQTSTPKVLFDFLASTRVVLVLFFLLVCLLVPATFSAELAPVLIKPVNVILALLGVNLAACTLRRLKTLRKSTLIMHLGCLTILAGSLVSSLGFVATVNIYEETSTDTVFNWDVEQDVPLGFDLRVARINTAFYPVDVKVGVLKNGKKAELVVTRTGNSFMFEGYQVQVVALDPRTRELDFAVHAQDGKRLGTLSTSGRKDLPPDFPLDFQLVAFKDPLIKRIWVDLELRENGKKVKSGTSEVNRPLRWQSLQLFLTQVNTDQFGRRYAGIQISRDPGIPFVYTGFTLLFLGLLLALRRWVAPGEPTRAL